MTLTSYLNKVAPLSLRQHGLVRDAGWEQHQATALNTYTYQQIRPQVQYESSSEPAKESQLAFIRARGIEVDITNPTYAMLRATIRSIAKHEAADATYLQYIEQAEQESDKRKQRRENARRGAR